MINEARRVYYNHEAVILGAIGLLLFGSAWELAARLGWLDPIILSSPSRVGDAFQRQWAAGEVLRDLRVSLLEFSVAFAISAFIGVSLGILMGLYRNAEYSLDPFIWFFYSAPIVAFYPLIIIWLGFGFWTVILISFILSVIPITINTLAAIRSVDPLLVRAVRSFGGNTLDVISKVFLPGALPLILAGLRIGVERALIGVVLGEMFSANAGVGFRLTVYGARLRTTDLLVPLFLILALGVIATQSIRFLENHLARWREA